MPDWSIRLYDAALSRLIACLIWLALRLEDLRKRTPRKLRSWQRPVASALSSDPPRPVVRYSRTPWNSTPSYVEELVRALHREHSYLGAGQLRDLFLRLYGRSPCRETIRRILLRTPPPRRKKRIVRRIKVKRTRLLWGIDYTLGFLLGLIPVAVLGIVDYRGSYLVALKRMLWPRQADVIHIFEQAVQEYGPPARVVSDNGSVFVGRKFVTMLDRHGIKHTRIDPGIHKRMVASNACSARSRKPSTCGSRSTVALSQIDRCLADFKDFYNRNRPHSSYRGLTPDEVYFGLPHGIGSVKRVSYFDGKMCWYGFG